MNSWEIINFMSNENIEGVEVQKFVENFKNKKDHTHLWVKAQLVLHFKYSLKQRFEKEQEENKKGHKKPFK